MIRVIADPKVESAFRGVLETVEIRSANGELLGYFCPINQKAASAVAAAAIDVRLCDQRECG